MSKRTKAGRRRRFRRWVERVVGNPRMVDMAPGISVWTTVPETPDEARSRKAREKEKRAKERVRRDRFATQMRAWGAFDVTETDRAITARFNAGPYTMQVRPEWAYLVARLDKPLPPGKHEVGYRVNHAPYMGPSGTKYSGVIPVLGSVCRAAGFAGGLFDDHFLSYCDDGLGFWHIDVPDALPVLIDTIRRFSAEKAAA